MPTRLLLLIAALTGCVPPSVMLGASYGLSRGRVPEGGDAFVRTRSALFVRLGAALEASAMQPPAQAHETDPLAPPATPCAFEAACAWERAEVARTQRFWEEP